MNGKLAAAAAAAALALSACTAPPPEMLTSDGVERVSADLAAYPDELATFRDSARKLGGALLADGGEGGNGNVVSSPASLLIALSMLRAGAGGDTAAEMDRVLGFPAAHRDEAMNALLASLEKFDGDPGTVDEKDPPRQPVLHTANGLFVDRLSATGEAYLDTLARHYGTGVYPVDFSDEDTTKRAIDAWVDKNTGGRIKSAPTQYDPKNTFSLLNTVYFASAWKVPFDPSDTSDLRFTTAAGEQISVPTMQTIADTAVAKGPGWQAVELPYADGFVMRLVLPDEGTPVADPGSFAKAVRALDEAAPSTVQIYLPSWDHKSKFELRKVFSGLGLTKMLGPDADFNAIQRGMVLTQAAQAANITVAEKGTVAAAVTQINAKETSAIVPPQVLRFDRPFHYEIVHVETGMPLFMGTIVDPRPAPD